MSIIQAIIGTTLTISGGTPLLNAYGWSNPMNEGTSNTVYITHENYPGTTLYFTIVNNTTSNSDWQGGVAPNGSTYIQGTGSTSFSWNTSADLTTEGSETYYLRIGTSPGGSDILNQLLTITDSSVTPVYYTDFTIEWWDKTESGDPYPRPWGVGQWPTQTIAISYEGGTDYFWINDTIIGTVPRTRIGQGWKHNAFVRRNGTVKGYIDGVEYFSASGNTPLVDLATPLFVGTGGTNGDYKGYIKDLHVIKGVAKYTGNFTPPTYPITPTQGTKFLLPVSAGGGAYDDVISYKSAIISGTVTYSEDDPYSYPGATFTAIGYGNNLITPSPMPANLRVGLKVSDGLGWSDYIIDPNYFGNIKLSSLPASTPPELVYTVSEDFTAVTQNTNTSGGNGPNTWVVDYSGAYFNVELLKVRQGWTVTQGETTLGIVRANAYLITPEVIRIGVNFDPTSASGLEFTYLPPTNGGSLYFDGASYINYGSSIDWAMDVSNNIVTSLVVDLDANNASSYSGTGTTWTDLETINGTNNATLINNPTFINTTPKSFNFDTGNLQYSTVPNIGSLSNWTVEVWFKTYSSLNNYTTMIAGNQFDGGNLNFSIGTNNSPIDYQVRTGFFNGAWHNTPGFTPNNAVWYHVVGTYDGTTLKQYVNGVLGGEAAYSGISASGGEIRIARRWDAGNSTDHFPGYIGLVRIYNSALTATETLARFEATRSIYGV